MYRVHILIHCLGLICLVTLFLYLIARIHVMFFYISINIITLSKDTFVINHSYMTVIKLYCLYKGAFKTMKTKGFNQKNVVI